MKHVTIFFFAVVAHLFCAVLTQAQVTGSGTINFIPKWTGTTTQGNSIIFQSPTTNNVGIGTASPASKLDVKGGGTFRGTLNLSATGTASSTQGFFSQPLDLTASAFNSSLAAAQNQRFRFRVAPEDNNTASPAGRLQLLFGRGSVTATPTGFEILSDGSQRIHTLNEKSSIGLFVVSASSSPNIGIFGIAEGSDGTGVAGQSNNGVSGIGVSGDSAVGFGVSGTSGHGTGVFGSSTGGFGVSGISTSASGVDGFSDDGPGVRGTSTHGSGVVGSSTFGLAGRFDGNVHVNGTLTKSSGSFKIDHPLDPANKYLSHSFVESPDMMNIYNGMVRLDAKGEAWVTMPDWFDALNRDFRYQLTSVGAPGPNLYIAKEISGNRFKISGGKAGSKVSWQVTGVREDAYANARRVSVEEEKPASERGHYLYPELYGAPKEKGTNAVQIRRHSELLRAPGK